MKAIVLVGGQGTRLRPLTLHRPKQMLPVVEKTMIERVLDHLKKHGIDEVVLSLGYKPDAFIAAFPDGVASGVKLSYAVEDEPLDTAGAIRFAASQVKMEETFAVLNGDVLTDLDITSLVQFHHQNHAKATIALTAVEDPSAFGVVVTDKDGRVSSFIEKPPRELAPSNLINAGIYILDPQVLDSIDTNRRVSMERETFPHLAKQGFLFATSSDAYWMDTGTPAKYLEAHADILTGLRGKPPLEKATEIYPGVWTTGDCDLKGKIMPYSLFGQETTVEENAEVSHSTIGRGVHVGKGATIERSVILPGSIVGPGARVEGSIVGFGAVIGRDAYIESECVLGDLVEVEVGSRLVGVRLS